MEKEKPQRIEVTRVEKFYIVRRNRMTDAISSFGFGIPIRILKPWYQPRKDGKALTHRTFDTAEKAKKYLENYLTSYETQKGTTVLVFKQIFAERKNKGLWHQIKESGMKSRF